MQQVLRKWRHGQRHRMRAVSWLLVLGAVAAPCPHSAARVSARSLLQSWNPQGWHSNGYDDRRIECEAAARLPSRHGLCMQAQHQCSGAVLTTAWLAAGRDQRWYDPENHDWRCGCKGALQGL